MRKRRLGSCCGSMIGSVLAATQLGVLQQRLAVPSVGRARRLRPGALGGSATTTRQSRSADPLYTHCFADLGPQDAGGDADIQHQRECRYLRCLLRVQGRVHRRGQREVRESPLQFVVGDASTLCRLPTPTTAVFFDPHSGAISVCDVRSADTAGFLAADPKYGVRWTTTQAVRRSNGISDPSAW